MARQISAQGQRCGEGVRPRNEPGNDDGAVRPLLDKEQVCWASSQYGMHPSSRNRSDPSNYGHQPNIVRLPIKVHLVECYRKEADQAFMQRHVL
jgi:hypothetical protein